MISSPIAIFLILTTLVVVAIYLEKNVKGLKKLGAAAMVILMGMILSNLGIIPGDSIVYDFLMDDGVNAALILILLSVDIRTIRKAGPEMLKAFGLGAIGSMAGSLLMFYFLADLIGDETWKLAGQFAGTYIGGGVNFAALGREFGTSSDLFTAGIAADVIITSLWFLACLIIPVLLIRNKNTSQQDSPMGVSTLEESLFSSTAPVGIIHFGVLIVLTLFTLFVSRTLADSISLLPQVLWLTTVALIFGQIPYIKKLPGGAMMGNYLLLLFLASNGAKSIVANIVQVGPEIFYYALGTILVHGLIIFGLGTLLRVNPAALAVASQANVGGSFSAMAMAGARGYGDKILPGIAVGLLGYAVGNYLGVAVAYLVS